MSSVPDILDDAVKRALKQLGIEGSGVIRPAKPQFGDYQANGLLAVGKFLKKDPKVFAQQIVDLISPELNSICEEIRVFGSGFITFKLIRFFVTDRIAEVA